MRVGTAQPWIAPGTPPLPRCSVFPPFTRTSLLTIDYFNHRPLFFFCANSEGPLTLPVPHFPLSFLLLCALAPLKRRFRNSSKDALIVHMALAPSSTSDSSTCISMLCIILSLMSALLILQMLCQVYRWLPRDLQVSRRYPGPDLTPPPPFCASTALSKHQEPV